jgi:hypothetical protein
MKREDIPVKTPDGRSQRITLSMVISVLALIVSISTFIISNLPHDSLLFLLHLLLNSCRVTLPEEILITI